MKITTYNLNEQGRLVEEMETPATPLAVGQIITYEDRANPLKEFVILGPLPPSNYTTPGTMRALCLEDGHDAQVREVDSNGHAGWQMGNRILSADELIDAIRTAGENKARIDAERAAAAIIKAEQQAAQRAQWAIEFAFLQTTASGCRSHVLGAKNIRAELKRAFPGIKFSVTSDSYTGGNSIDVHWQAGPTKEAVEKITGKYQEGHFDGMEDIYRDSGNQWPDIYGGAKYVMEQRSFPNELHDAIGRSLCELQGIEFAGQYTLGLLGENDDRDLQQHINQLLKLTTWPAGAEFDRVDEKEFAGEDCDTFKRLFETYGQGFYNKTEQMTPADQVAFSNYQSRQGLHWCRIVFKSNGGGNQPEAKPEPTAPTQAETVSAGSGATVKTNAEKNGVEIHFASKPAAEVLAQLKSAGWRWSRFSSCWYHKNTPENLAFANQLAGAGVPTVANIADEPVKPEEKNPSGLAEVFAETAPAFRATMRKIADESCLEVLAVFKLWQDYSAECRAGDQCPIESEFIRHKAKQIGVTVEKKPAEPLSLPEYYAQGVGKSVLDSYKAARVVDCDCPAVPLARNSEPQKRISPLVEELKQAGQDGEFYPTTNEIIDKLCRCISLKNDNDSNIYGHSSVLDIGAGNGKVLNAIKERCGIDSLHAIEKSPILCAELDKDILIVGTDFHEQSLLSKTVDVIFCNPPYSEYEIWAEKIIRQAASRNVYLVLPCRWENSQRIKDALKFRDVSARIVGKFDFADAEDRRARSVVHLIDVNMRRSDRKETYGDERGEDDAFNRFFEEQFADLINKFKASEARPAGDKAEREEYREAKRPEFSGLVVGANYPETLVGLYNAEMSKIYKNYQLCAQLDAELLKEFAIEPKTILKCLKERLNGLKNDYWMELFSNLGTITSRLTSASRKELLGRLHSHVSVDFTVSNILEVVLWVIKNANSYIDSQLIEVYENMVAKCNVTLYKSNKKTWEESGWRYGKPEVKNTHYALDYRIVTHRMGGIENRWGREELDQRAAEFIGDLRTIARNLGFDPSGDMTYSLRNLGNWRSGQTEEFFFRDKTVTTGRVGFGTLFDVKAFKNGNLHLRLNKKFILALNVEHGRLKGWLRSGEQAAEELQDKDAAQYFNGNQQISAGSPFSMLAEKTIE